MAIQDVGIIGELGPLIVRSASDAAAQMLRNAIISGTLKPGDRLVEQKLAGRMGIGQPTLREALKQLEFEGFVRKEPQRGTYVTKLDKEDYRKILELRVVLEGFAIGLAAKNMKPEAEAELVTLVEEMGTATVKSDLAEFHQVDVAFHRKIWELTGNEFLTKALESVVFPVFAFALLDLGPELMRHRQESVQEHEGILAGLLTHDPVKARQAFGAHTLRYWNEVYHLNVKLDEPGVVSSIQEVLTN